MKNIRPFLNWQSWDSYHEEKSLNSPAAVLFLVEVFCFRVASTAGGLDWAFLAFKYFPTPPPAAPSSATPVPGLLYHDPTLS